MNPARKLDLLKWFNRTPIHRHRIQAWHSCNMYCPVDFTYQLIHPDDLIPISHFFLP